MAKNNFWSHLWALIAPIATAAVGGLVGFALGGPVGMVIGAGAGFASASAASAEATILQKQGEKVIETGDTIDVKSKPGADTTAPATTGTVNVPSEEQLAQKSEVLNLTKQAAWQRSSSQQVLSSIAKGYTSLGTIKANAARSGIRLEGSPLYQATIAQKTTDTMIGTMKEQRTLQNSALTQSLNISFGSQMLQVYNDINKINQNITDVYLGAFSNTIGFLGQLF